MPYERTDSNRGRTRRSLITTTGLTAVAALAGCLGGDDDAIRMRTSQSTTTAYNANEALATSMNGATDEFTVDAQTSDGTEANIGSLMNEESEMVYIQNWSAREASEGEGAYDEIDFELTQVFHFYSLPWFFVTANEELETISDISEEMELSPTPEGSGTAPALESALEHALDGYERVSHGYGDQGGAMNEGRLDVGVGTYMNYEFVPGWMQEMMGTVDLRILGIDDDVLEAWEDDDDLLVESFDGDEIEEADYAPAEVHTPAFEYNFVCRGDLDYDTVYEFLEVMHDQRDELDHDLLESFQDEAFWYESLYDDIPVHAAAADFYDDIGLWDDRFERADEP